MRWAVVTLTKGAMQLGKIIARGMSGVGDGKLYISERFIDFCGDKGEKFEIYSVKKPFNDFVGVLFNENDAIIFVMATGIVCRSIASHIENKTKDPAIIVCDEAGKYAISLLSGHLGGANELSKKVAGFCDGQPVITTASDVTGNVAVDMLAKSINAKISSMNKAKVVTAIAVDGKKIIVLIDKNRYEDKFYSVKLDKLKSDKFIIKIIDGTDNQLYKQKNFLYKNNEFDYQIDSINFDYHTIFDTDVELARSNSDGVIVISENKLKACSDSVQLIPKSLSLGIGCKRGTPINVISDVFDEACEIAKIDNRAIKSIATIGLKADEIGINALCEKLNLQLDIIDLDDIKHIHNQFKGSDFVQKTVGVRAVSEPCAKLSGNENGYMRLGRYAKNGVTISLWEDL